MEHVKNLQFKPTVASLPLKLTTSVTNALAARSRIEIDLNGTQTLKLKLTEACPAGKLDLMVTLFQEGDRISLTPINGDAEQPLETTIRSISGNTLTVAPFRTPFKLDRGSRVTSDNDTASVLTEQLTANTLINSMVVQGIESGQKLKFPPDDQPFDLQASGTPPDQQLALGQRLRVPESFLVYSGNHTITIVPS